MNYCYMQLHPNDSVFVIIKMLLLHWSGLSCLVQRKKNNSHTLPSNCKGNREFCASPSPLPGCFIASLQVFEGAKPCVPVLNTLIPKQSPVPVGMRLLSCWTDDTNSGWQQRDKITLCKCGQKETIRFAFQHYYQRQSFFFYFFLLNLNSILSKAFFDH